MHGLQTKRALTLEDTAVPAHDLLWAIACRGVKAGRGVAHRLGWCGRGRRLSQSMLVDGWAEPTRRVAKRAIDRFGTPPRTLSGIRGLLMTKLKSMSASRCEKEDSTAWEEGSCLPPASPARTASRGLGSARADITGSQGNSLELLIIEYAVDKGPQWWLLTGLRVGMSRALGIFPVKQSVLWQPPRC